MCKQHWHFLLICLFGQLMSSGEEIDFTILTSNLLAAVLNISDPEIYSMDGHNHVNFSAY